MKFFCLCVILLSFTLSGCSALISSKRSTWRGDTSVIKVGASRAVIEEELGEPDLAAQIDEKHMKAVYRLNPNAQKAALRNAAVAGHAAASVFTMGGWELIGPKLEDKVRDKFVHYVIVYDTKNVVQSVNVMN